MTESTHKLIEVTGRNWNDGIYTLSWEDGESYKYPFVWLKDNCRCSKCYHPSSYQRMSLMVNLDPEIKPQSEEITQDGSMFKIIWPDEHVGEYPTDWLRQHRFNQSHFDPISDIKPKPWGTELNGKIPMFKYEDVMKDDSILLEWLNTLYTIGLTVLTDGPTKTGTLQEIGKRVAYLRETVYGYTFQVFSKINTSSLAYTGKELGLHVDLPFYNFCPGVQMLHCIRQTKGKGGENQFSDAFKTALCLKTKNPSAYKLLTSVDTHFRNVGSDHIDQYHLITGRPIIEEDRDGNFKQVYYNDPVRASYLNVPVENVRDVYRAIKLFHQTLQDNLINIKLKDGQIVVFNNTRVMHGRYGYQVEISSTEQIRHYEGAYIEWDEIHSRMRVLREKQSGELRI